MATPPSSRTTPATIAWSVTAVAFGYTTGRWDLSPVLLLAIPFGDLIAHWLNRHEAFGPRRSDAQDRLVTELESARRRIRDAEARASSATAGLVTAADLAVRMEEEMRSAIVADLHDSVAQTLVAMAYLRYDPDVKLDQIVELATVAERELRDVMVSQRPVVDRMRSMADSIKALVADLEDRRGLTVEVLWAPPEVPFPHPVAVAVYRFAAETLVNVSKHAGVDRAHLAVTGDQKTIVVEVVDAGAGFHVSELETTNRLGLALLGHRAEMLGATITVRSRPGEGTRATMTIELDGMLPAGID